MLNLIAEPFQYTFMQKAFIGILLASINCSLIGAYVVLRRMAFLGEALTHTLLPGIVFAYLRGLHLFFGALGASIITVLGIGLLSSRQDTRQDSVIGIMLSFMFALGVLMMSMVNSFRDFSSILFGSILGVTTGDLFLMVGITVLVASVLILVHKELELSSFDLVYSRLIHARPELLKYVLLLLIALSVVSAVQMIGALLTTALLIIPAAASSLLVKTLPRLMALSCFFAVISGVLGLYFSYYFEVSSGAIIVINCFGCFVAASIIKSLRSIRLFIRR